MPGRKRGKRSKFGLLKDVQLDSMRWFAGQRRTGGCKAPANCTAEYCSCKPPSSYIAVTLSPLCSNAVVSSAAACSVLRMAHALLCIVSGDDSAGFCFFPSDLDLWPLIPKFRLRRDFCTMHLTAKFHRPTFNRLEVIVPTHCMTKKQMLLKTSTSLCYANG